MIHSAIKAKALILNFFIPVSLQGQQAPWRIPGESTLFSQENMLGI